jgi:hypothetical protein
LRERERSRGFIDGKIELVPLSDRESATRRESTHPLPKRKSQRTSLRLTTSDPSNFQDNELPSPGYTQGLLSVNNSETQAFRQGWESTPVTISQGSRHSQPYRWCEPSRRDASGHQNREDHLEHYQGGLVPSQELQR